MTEPAPRKPLDDRPLTEQYQFTQADAILSREHAKEQQRRKARKRRHWLWNWLIVISFFAMIILLI